MIAVAMGKRGAGILFPFLLDARQIFGKLTFQFYSIQKHFRLTFEYGLIKLHQTRDAIKKNKKLKSIILVKEKKVSFLYFKK